jgi:hypothetical protein
MFGVEKKCDRSFLSTLEQSYIDEFSANYGGVLSSVLVNQVFAMFNFKCFESKFFRV